jgi:hypothetical protein
VGGRKVQIGEHANVPLDLPIREVVARFGLKSHMTAVFEYSDGTISPFLKGAE